jgi:hypothetical protein
MIDIEKPSTVSFQHVFFLKKKLNVSEIKKKESKLIINSAITYPIHFRYRRPSSKSLYKEARINGNPRIYMDCLKNKEEFEKQLNKISFYDQMIAEYFSNDYLHLKNGKGISNQIFVKVPTGNSNLLDVVLFITLGLTILAALYLSLLIVKKKID